MSGTVAYFSDGDVPNAARFNQIVSGVNAAVRTGTDVSTNTAVASGFGNSLTLAQMLRAFGGVPIGAFGAVGNGVADDGPAFQAAANWLQANGGGEVFLEGLTYRVASAVVITCACTFVGIGWPFPDQSGDLMPPSTGTWIYIDQVGINPFTFTNTAPNNARGTAGFRRCGYWQKHPALGAGWAATPYPPVISATEMGGGIWLEDLMFANVYQGVYLLNAAQHTVRGFFGQFFSYGIYADSNEDASRYDEFHIWPFWSTGQYAMTYAQANCDAIYFLRNDGPMMGRIFVLGCRSGLRMAQSVYGGVNDLFCDQFYADACHFPVWVDNTATSATATFNQIYTGGQNAYGGGVNTGSVGIQIDGAGTFKFGQTKILYCAAYALNLANSTLQSVVYFETLEVLDWDQQGVGVPAIFAANQTPVNTVAHQIYIAQRPSCLGAPNNNNQLISLNNTNARLWCPGLDYQYVTGSLNGLVAGVTPLPNIYFEDTTAATSIASLGVILPSNPIDGMEVTICVNKPVTVMDWAVGTPSTAAIKGAPSALAAYSPVTLKFFGIGALSTSVFWVVWRGFSAATIQSSVTMYNGLDVVAGGLAVGGTTLLNGVVGAPNIPTADPHIAGNLWRSGNALMVSTG